MRHCTRSTYQIAMAAGRDAANRSAARSGRTIWNDDDLDVALEVFNRLYCLAVGDHSDPADASTTRERD